MLQHIACTLLTLSLTIHAAWAHEEKQTDAATDASHIATSNANLDVATEAAGAVSALDAFSAALAAGQLATAADYLAPDVLILESGGAERSRDEYLAGHAGHDAEFLRGAKVVPKRRSAHADGGLVWVGSESEIHASSGDKPLTLSSTETAILRHTDDGWKIVHLHWSSRRLDTEK